MPFEKGKSGNPEGRPKGSKNKVSTSLKDMFLAVFEDTGGVEKFKEWVNANNRNRQIFYGWLSKMLPSNVVEDIKHEFEPLTVIINEDRDEPDENS